MFKPILYNPPPTQADLSPQSKFWSGFLGTQIQTPLPYQWWVTIRNIPSGTLFTKFYEYILLLFDVCSESTKSSVLCMSDHIETASNDDWGGNREFWFGIFWIRVILIILLLVIIGILLLGLGAKMTVNIIFLVSHTKNRLYHWYPFWTLHLHLSFEFWPEFQRILDSGIKYAKFDQNHIPQFQICLRYGLHVTVMS